MTFFITYIFGNNESSKEENANKEEEIIYEWGIYNGCSRGSKMGGFEFTINLDDEGIYSRKVSKIRKGD